jgi:hypothetical protein
MTWNPFKRESVWRSKGVQGFLSTAVGLALQVLGSPVGPEEVVSAVSLLLEGVGAVWALIGRLTARRSPRPF